MNTDELGLSGDPEPLIDSLAREKDNLGGQGHHGHGGPIETVRESTYRGHRIVVRTTYSITVDDVAIEGHLGVSNDGQVHYHAIPNLGFASAIELVKQLVDAFPDDFADPPGYGAEAPSEGADPPGGGEGDPPPHEHEHGPGEHEHGGH
jgi:hypothetical protein